MKDLKIEILPHRGMPGIDFGVSTKQVAGILGDPPESELLEEDDEFFTPTLIWHYPESGLSFFFEGAEHQLTSIESDHTDTMLFGQRIFDLSRKQIEELMAANGFHDMDSELEAWGEDRLSWEDALIDYYFDEGGSLVSVDWGIIPE